MKYTYATFNELFRDRTFEHGPFSISLSSRSGDIQYLEGDVVIARAPRDAMLTETNIKRYRESLGFGAGEDVCRVNGLYNALVDLRNELAGPFFENLDSVEEGLSYVDAILDELLAVQNPSADDLLDELDADYEWPVPANKEAA